MWIELAYFIEKLWMMISLGIGVTWGHRKRANHEQVHVGEQMSDTLRKVTWLERRYC